MVVLMRQNIQLDISEVKKTYDLDDEDIKFIQKYSFLWSDESNSVEFVNSPLKDYSNHNSFNFRDVIVGKMKNKNVTALFFIDLIYRIKHNKNIVAVAYSDTGIGKSYYMIRMCQIIEDYCKSVLNYEYKVFSNEHIVFNIDEYLILGEKAKRNFCLMNDEEDLEHFGVGSFTNNVQYNRFQQLMRSQQFHHFSCSPEMRKWITYHYAIEMIGIDEVKGLSAGVWIGNNNNVPSPIGLVVLDNPCKYDNNLMIEYEKRKKLNQELFKKRELGVNTKLRWLNSACDVIIKAGFIGYKGKLHKKNFYLSLNTLYPRAFGIREQDIIVELIDCFLKNKPMVKDDKEFMTKYLNEHKE